MLYVIGQIFGGIAVILGFVSFQMKSAKKLLIAQAAVTVAFCVHYLLIGAMTGFMMNAVAFIRNIAYYTAIKSICPRGRYLSYFA